MNTKLCIKILYQVIIGPAFGRLGVFFEKQAQNFFKLFQVIKPKENSLSWHTGTEASQQVFEKSGTVVLTNAMLQNSPRARSRAGGPGLAAK